MIIRKLATVATAALVLTAAPALASQPESAARTVHYADLNLATPVGVKTLHRRIATALEAVCGSYAGTESAGMANEADEITRCRAAAQAKADVQVAAIVSRNVRLAAR